VELTDTIDVSKFDMSTFRFTGFGFGDSIYSITIPDHTYSRNIDLRPPRRSILRIVASVNLSDGILKWGFYTLDTLTLALIDDPDEGFLPPNVVSPEGEGFISYSLIPKPLPHLTEIENRASIVFDYNAPILTPYWLNTIDLLTPQSLISITPHTWPDTTFTLHFAGSDAHSGVHYHEVWCSINDSAYQKLALITDDIDSLVVAGNVGTNYKFYTRAVDRVENRESAPATPDAEITIVDPDGIEENRNTTGLSLTVMPSPFASYLNLRINSVANGDAEITLHDFTGREVLSLVAPVGQGLNEFVLTLDETLSKGIYTLNVRVEGEVESLKVIKQ
jgi:hypothetical protein